MREMEYGFEHTLDKFLYSKRFRKIWNRLIKTRVLNTPVIYKILAKMMHFNFEDYNIYFIGTSHLDAAWLWTAVDSKVRAYKTFKMGIENIKKYPYFSISITSPQYYNWIKKYDTNLWKDVKKYVAKGKIDTLGGMWIEPDLNVPSGEALVRQRLYGQLYYLRNFGKISTCEALLDVFGYPNTIPQIIKKSGGDVFWTTKLTWNDYSLWPFANYIWRSPDGSEIFTHMFKFNIMALMDMGLYKKTSRIPNKKGLVYDSSKIIDCEYITPLNMYGNRVGKPDWSKLSELDTILKEDYVDTVGIFYGLGDGGKGPLSLEVDIMERISQQFNFKHTTGHNYFKILRNKVGDNFVTWDDEMYLEYHRGTLTTHAKVKKGNRLAENKLISAEHLCTSGIMSDLFENFEYPKELFEDCWQKVMFNQFHDILPGSSIPEVYLLTWKEHEYVINKMDELIEKFLKSIHSGLEPSQQQYVVYNPVAAENSGSISYNGFEIPTGKIDASNIYLFKQTDLDNWIEEYDTDLELAENADTIIIKNSKIKAVISKKDGNLKGLQGTGNEIFEACGNLLYGERNGFKKRSIPDPSDIGKIHKEMIKLKGARIKAYKENFKDNPYPAWNISRNYTQNPIKIQTSSTEIIHNNKDRIEIESEYKILTSTIKIRYILRTNCENLDINIDIDLKDPEILLKYFVPFNIKSNDTTEEMQFGSVIRKRVPSTKMEAAKWEFSMHKWLDISDEDLGLSILNDSRYAASANKKGIGITLVRSAIYASSGHYSHEKLFNDDELKPKHTDLMPHNFKLSLLPHSKTWKEAGIPQKALAFNNPLYIISSSEKKDKNYEINLKNSKALSKIIDNETGNLPFKKLVLPSIETNKDNLIISCFKPGEWIKNGENIDMGLTSDGFQATEYLLPEEPLEWKWDKKSIIIRAYEATGRKTEGILSIKNISKNIRVQSVEEIDMLEWKSGTILDFEFEEKENPILKIKTKFTGYEIKTIRVNLE